MIKKKEISEMVIVFKQIMDEFQEQGYNFIESVKLIETILRVGKK